MSTAPFIERKRLIEAKVEPFVPPYSEDPEPAYLKEWLEAEESLQVIGRTCISMLAAVFHLYFKTWEHNIGRPVDPSRKVHFKKGWFNGYKTYFQCHYGIRFENAPCRLDMLEEIVLVRNRGQHPEFITMEATHYSESDLRKICHPFFIDEFAASLFFDAEDSERAWLMTPPISVTADKLFAAFSEVERFVEWLENAEVKDNAS